MNKLFHSVNTFLKDEEGAVLTEYILVIVVIAFAAMVGMKLFATQVNEGFEAIGNVLEDEIDDID